MRRDLRVLVSPPVRTERHTMACGGTGGSVSGLTVQVKVAPCQRPQLLGTGAREQRHQDVGAHRRPARMFDQRLGLLKGEGLGGPSGLAGRGAAQQDHVAADLVPALGSGDRSTQDGLEVGDRAGAERRGLLDQPLVDLVGGEVDEFAGAERGNHVLGGEDAFRVHGDVVAAGQAVVEPVGDGLGDGVAVLGGGHAVVVVTDQVFELRAGLGLGATGWPCGRRVCRSGCSRW